MSGSIIAGNEEEEEKGTPISGVDASSTVAKFYEEIQAAKALKMKRIIQRREEAEAEAAAMKAHYDQINAMHMLKLKEEAEAQAIALKAYQEQQQHAMMLQLQAMASMSVAMTQSASMESTVSEPIPPIIQRSNISNVNSDNTTISGKPASSTALSHTPSRSQPVPGHPLPSREDQVLPQTEQHASITETPAPLHGGAGKTVTVADPPLHVQDVVEKPIPLPPKVVSSNIQDNATIGNPQANSHLNQGSSEIIVEPPSNKPHSQWNQTATASSKMDSKIDSFNLNNILERYRPVDIRLPSSEMSPHNRAHDSYDRRNDYVGSTVSRIDGVNINKILDVISVKNDDRSAATNDVLLAIANKAHGRIGEHVAKDLLSQLFDSLEGWEITWCNETDESSLPYDFIINYKGPDRSLMMPTRYVEVKTRVSERDTISKWFISPNELSFASEIYKAKDQGVYSCLLLHLRHDSSCKSGYNAEHTYFVHNLLERDSNLKFVMQLESH